ncbi:MAG TPA: NAD(P)-dependent oxidoreductase [Solirubrobacteraceae bacterium]|jgi:3-hydroxyisobutyrate dehydrogenase|nr:NAD(P)-dependent oxidoreductase [Solirubrobacteraceae bacterium]
MSGRVGFIGLGIMGSRMAANLRRAGFELTVFNRTTRTAEEWAAEHGARVASSPAELAAECDTVITMVVDGAQVEGVLLGTGGADAPWPSVREAARDGLLCVDMSTIAPSQTRAIAASLAERRVRLVDAPVTGSAPRAADGTLTIMAGGVRDDYDRALPLFAAMGELVVHVGPLGQGQMVKLINNAVAAVNAATVAQALLVGRRTGVDLDALERVMRAGSGASAMLELKAAAMRSHDYTTLFKLEHMLKDVRLCLEEGQAAGVPFPFAALIREVLTAARGRGLGDHDFAALLEVLEAESGIRL